MKREDLTENELKEAFEIPRKNNPNMKCYNCSKLIPLGDFAHEINLIGNSNKYYACSNECKHIIKNKLEKGELI